MPMAPALKDEVLKRLKAGSEVGAILHYQSVTGEDLATAKDVVKRLAR